MIVWKIRAAPIPVYFPPKQPLTFSCVDRKKIAYVSIDVYSFSIHKRRNIIIHIFFCTLSLSFAVIVTAEHLGRTFSLWELGIVSFPPAPLWIWVCRLLAVRGLLAGSLLSVGRRLLLGGVLTAWSCVMVVLPGPFTLILWGQFQCPLAQGVGGCPSWMCVCPTEEVLDCATSERTPVPRGRRGEVSVLECPPIGERPAANNFFSRLDFKKYTFNM